MDLSKLPKLSDTSRAENAAHAPDPATAVPVQPIAPVEPIAPVAQHRYAAAPPPLGVGVDVWISTVLGVLFVFLGITFAKFAVAKLTHQPFHTGVNWVDDAHPPDTEVSYFELQGHTAWSDMGVFLFGLTLLFEALSKAAVALKPGTASRLLLKLALLLTLATVALNLVTCGLIMHDGLVPLLAGIAVAFGGWILADEWNTLRATSRVSSAISA